MKSKLFASIIAVFALQLAAATLQAGAKVELNAFDTMKYDKTALEVPAGEEITLVFNNKGSLPKAAMGHNVVILAPGTDTMAFGAAAVPAAANEYIPQNEPFASQIVAHTKLLGPGETTTITFTLDDPGEYPFVCSFPGHYVQMKGIITAN